MSSPNLNNVILMGTAFIYASVVLYGVDMNLVTEEQLLVFCQVSLVIKTYQLGPVLCKFDSPETKQRQIRIPVIPHGTTGIQGVAGKGCVHLPLPKANCPHTHPDPLGF